MRHFALPVLLASFLLLVPGRAAAFDEMIGPRATGAGGALRAAGAGSAAVFLNPGGLSLTRAYVIEAAYDFRPGDNSNIVGASITDSVTTRVAAGLYYTFLNAQPGFGGVEYLRRGHEVGMAVAYPIGDVFHLGVTNKYLYVDTKADSGALPGARAHGYTLDVGGILRLGSVLNLGVVGQNLVNVHSFEAPRTLGLGLAAVLSTLFLLEFDAVIRWRGLPDLATGTALGTRARASYHVGTEYFFGGAFPLRLGYSRDYRFAATRDDNFFHAGIGYITTAFGAEFGIRQQLGGSGAETLLAFALKLFVQ
jgi:hypothetical protein